MTPTNPFLTSKTSLEIIRLAVMICVRFPLSLRNVEYLLHECGIDVSHEVVRLASGFCRIAGDGTRSGRCLQQRLTSAGLRASFNLERHFYFRNNFKENRTAALTEWRQLLAA